VGLVPVKHYLFQLSTEKGAIELPLFQLPQVTTFNLYFLIAAGDNY
jgi:hypothetical protein